MLRSMVFAAVLCGGLVAAGAAGAEPYISASIGASFRPITRDVLSLNTDPFGNSVTQNGKVVPYQIERDHTFKTGLDAEVAAGFRFKLGGAGAIRTEIDAEYGEYTLDTVTGHSLPSSVYLTTYAGQAVRTSGAVNHHGAVTVNAFYDFPHLGILTPYVGGGVGYHYALDTTGFSTGTDTITSGGVTIKRAGNLNELPAQTHAGIYLVEVGVAIAVSKNFSVVPAYRYTQQFNGGLPLSEGKVGVRYSFN